MVYYKNCLGYFPSKTFVIISSFSALIFYTLLAIFFTIVYGITIYYGPDQNPFKPLLDYTLGPDWNMFILDMVFGLIWIGIIIEFAVKLLLLYGVQKVQEAYILPFLVLKMTVLLVGTITGIIHLIKMYMQDDTEYYILYVAGYIFMVASGFYYWDVVFSVYKDTKRDRRNNMMAQKTEKINLYI